MDLRPSGYPHLAAEVSTRSEEPGDGEFLVRLFTSTRSEELLACGWSAAQITAFCDQQFRAQRHSYLSYPELERRLILYSGIAIGRIYLSRIAANIRIADISLLPEFRGAGIGTTVLQVAVAEAEAQGCSLSLHVAHFNPALRLYLRLGFEVTGDDGVSMAMLRKCGTPLIPQQP